MKTDYSADYHMTNVDRDLEVNYSCHVNENPWYIHTYLLTTSSTGGGFCPRGLCPGNFCPGRDNVLSYRRTAALLPACAVQFGSMAMK